MQWTSRERSLDSTKVAVASMQLCVFTAKLKHLRLVFSRYVWSVLFFLYVSVGFKCLKEPQKDLMVNGLGIESKTYGRVEPSALALKYFVLCDRIV